LKVFVGFGEDKKSEMVSTYQWNGEIFKAKRLTGVRNRGE